jgi:histidinol-phosphate phosphatase family protein
LSKAFVIFDRDGTVIDHVHHLRDPNSVKVKGDLVESLERLQAVGFRFGLITNQSIIGRGIATHEQVTRVNNVIFQQLSKEGIYFEFVYVCPHMPEDGCECRKPRIGLGLQAIIEHQMAPALSYVIGDQESDLIFAKTLGCTAIQVLGKEETSEHADYYSATLKDAVSWIIEQS